MSYSVNPSLWSRVFPIPTDITDKHIKMCSGVALKCLLLILRSPDEYSELQPLAQKLNQPASEIADALNYWEEQGILLRCENGVLPQFKPVEPSAAVTPIQAPVTAAPPAPKPAAERPRFPRDEALKLIENDHDLHYLAQELQEILKKPLTSADMDVLAALYSFYGLSAHYILSLVDYCAAIGKRGMAYAERVAVSWLNDGIDDSLVDKHIDELMRRRSNEGLIRREFGINDRALTSKEKEAITRWFDEFGFDITMIKLAFEITVNRTGKAAFNYMNKILQNWRENGVKTPDDVKRESESFKQPPQNVESAAEIDKKLLEQFMKE